MGFLFSGLFWGSVFILIGITIILKVVFDIEIPVFRLIFGFLFILIGIQILFGKPFMKRPFHAGEGDVMFTEGRQHFNPAQKEYNTIFGKNNLDLSGWNEKSGIFRIEVNTIFGNTRVQIPEKIPLKIKSDTVFGNSLFPDQSVNGFGSHIYTSQSFKEGKPYLFIELNTVFGLSEILN